MRILFLTFYFKPDLSAGSFRSNSLVKALQEIASHGDSIEIVTTHPNRYLSFRKNALDDEKYDKVLIKRIKIPNHKSGFLDQSISFLTYFMQTIKYVSSREYDIVFATSSRLLTAFLATLIATQKKIPLYLDIRDIFVENMKSILPRNKQKMFLPVFKCIEKYIVINATKINLVSEGFLPYFNNKYNKQYSIFSNGIDDDFLNFKGDDRPLIKDSKLIMTYTGNIGEGQGLEKIVPLIAARFTNIKIIIIGDGGRKNMLLKACEKLNNVLILSPVGRKEIVEYYKRTDILFLHLNDYEAFKKVLPSKIFEYGATFKPIIAGVDGYAKEFIHKNLADSMIFMPCNFTQFCTKYQNFRGIVNIKDRNKFIKKYSRDRLMLEMAKDILSIKRMDVLNN